MPGCAPSWQGASRRQAQGFLSLPGHDGRMAEATKVQKADAKAVINAHYHVF